MLMWYIDLLIHLAKKICKTDHRSAARFIVHLFNLDLIEAVFRSYDLELSMLLGFLKDLYLFAEENSARDVPLAEFSRECMGLFILHMKVSDDLSIFVGDFAPFLRDKIIFSSLSIKKEVIQLHLRAREDLPSEPFEKFLSTKNSRELSKVTSDKIFTDVLKKIEQEVFSKLEHNVSVSPIQLMEILPKLLNEIDNQLKVVTDMLFYFLLFEHENKQFDRLILKIKKIRDMLLSPVINEICERLNQYIENCSPYPFSFHNAANYKYSKEVANIVRQIKEGELDDIYAVVEKLNEIRMSPNDELTKIIQSIEEQYASIIFEI